MELMYCDFLGRAGDEVFNQIDAALSESWSLLGENKEEQQTEKEEIGT